MAKQRKKDSQKFAVKENDLPKQKKLKTLPKENEGKDDGTLNKSYSNASLIKRIKHGSNEIREMTLSTLCMTLFDPNSLEKHEKKISKELLEAISEKISDLNTSNYNIILNALGCMQNYIQFSKEEKVNEFLLSSSVVDINSVLLNRISNSVQYISLNSNSVKDLDIDEKASSKKKKKKKNKKHSSIERSSAKLVGEWNVLQLCLSCMNSLLENCSLSVDMLTSQDTTYNPSLLSTASETIKVLLNVFEKKANNEKLAENKKECLRLICQILHTSLDDNKEFSDLSSSSDQLISSLKQVVEHKSLYPKLAQLHCVGSIVNLQSTSSDYFEKVMLPLLHEAILEFSSEEAQAQMEEIAQKLTLLNQERQDESLENDVIAMVTHRNESAISIARRLKKKDKKKYMEEDEKLKSKRKGEKNHVIMEAEITVDENVITNQTKEEKSRREESIKSEENKDILNESGEQEGKEDAESQTNNDGEPDYNNQDSILPTTEQEYNTLLNSWNNYISPIELSLELITNLCLSREEDDMSVDDATNQVIFQQMNAIDLPKTLCTLFFTFCHLSSYSSQDLNLEEVGFKCSACLGNLFQNCMPLLLEKKKISIESVWNQSVQAIESCSHSSSSVVHTMASLLRSLVFHELMSVFSFSSKEQLMKEIDILLNIVSKEKNEEYQSNIVFIVGILVSLGQQKELVEKVTKSFLFLVSSEKDELTSLDYEIINVFMEIFGNDDFDLVFSQCKVLEILQTWLKKGLTPGNEDEYFQEILENLVRFIEFKQSTIAC